MNKVLYSTAKQLAEKGFNRKCSHVYEDSDGTVGIVCAQYFMEGESAVDKDDIERVIKNSQEYYENTSVVLCPYQNQVIDWLREKHNIVVQINPLFDHDLKRWTYGWKIIKLYDDGKTESWEGNLYICHIDACENAIKSCLVNLI